MPTLNLLLKGIKRIQNSPTDKRKSIDNEILEKIFNNLGNNHDNQLVKTVLTFGKCLMLRCSEYTIDNGLKYNKKLLKWNQIKMIPSNNPQKVIIILNNTKGSQFAPVETGDICRCPNICLVHQLLK